MKKLLKSMALLLMISAGIVNGQEVLNKNINNYPLGVYTRDQVISDWSTTSGNGFIKNGQGENRVSIVSRGNGNKCFKVKYPANKFGSTDSGAQWETNLGGQYESLYMSYNVKLGPNFGLNKIGKFPGLSGGLFYKDDGANTDWSGKLMWRAGGKMEFYLHQPVNNTKKFPWILNDQHAKLTTGKWYNIEIYYKLNDVGSANGKMEAWLDGVKVAELDNIPFRKNAGVKINTLFFSTFYGGKEESAPNQTNYAEFDDFKVSTQRIGTSGTGGANQNPVASGIFVLSKRNTNHFMDTGWGASNKQPVKLYDQRDNDNQKFEEINQGNGYYSYKKKGTNYAIDGGNGGADGQPVYLYAYNASNYNQHWKKINAGDNHYILQKRNAPDFAIDAGFGVANNRPLVLKPYSRYSHKQHWLFNSVNSSKSATTQDELTSDISEDKIDLPRLSLFPNPVKEVLSLKGDFKTTSAVNTYNYTGQLVHSVKPGNGSGELITIQTVNWKPGIYFVEIVSNEESAMHKVIKM